jgi:hypothetical protein
MNFMTINRGTRYLIDHVFAVLEGVRKAARVA